jgi:hypothetical protein
LDSVTVLEELTGVTPEGGPIVVPAGSTGVVVSENRARDWYEVEFDGALFGATPGIPAAFAEVTLGMVKVTRRHRGSVA